MPLPCRPFEELQEKIARLDRLSDAPAVAGEIAGFCRSLADGRFSGDALVRTLSKLNDAFNTRIIKLTARRHRLPVTRWCWVALGSEGRHEQTLTTDQDNGLVFEAADQAEAGALRELFVPFAREVNEHLAASGFTLCPGGIMAGNPDWCLSFDEWRTRFIDWIRCPEPPALLNASIFFDLRPIHGDVALAEKLQSIVLSLSKDSPGFLRLMADNALQAEVPLNFMGDIAVDSGKTMESLDLKKYGSRIFVDVARIFALAHGTTVVNTPARLRLVGPAAGLTAGELAAAEAAFSHLLRLRLIRQSNPEAEWHELDKVILRESFKQARRLQQRLKLNYGL